MQMIIRAFLVSLAVALLSQAQAAGVLIVMSGESGPYAEFASRFVELNRQSPWKVSQVVRIDQLSSVPARPDLIIAVGSAAFRAAMAQSDAPPILATLIPRHAYETILKESLLNGSRGVSSAIFLDQPEPRLATFIRLLLPSHSRIGLLTSEETRSRIAPLRQALGSLYLDHVEASGDSSVLGLLNELLPRVNLLLALPDSSIYKRDNIKPILVTSYRHQRPLIAFSQAFVKAGALAAIYSTPVQIAQQASELLRTLPPGTRQLPAPLPPSQFAISINRSVAESLNLDLPDEAVLHRQMGADGEPK